MQAPERKRDGKRKRRTRPPLTAAEAMREGGKAAGIHTSASDIGGASSASKLREADSRLWPALEYPACNRPLEVWALSGRDKWD